VSERVRFTSLYKTRLKQHEGTIAATAQSSTRNVAAGSVFATLQSVGAGSAGLAAVNGAVQIGGGLMATLGPGITFCKLKL
jgi:hypothetical protein